MKPKKVYMRWYALSPGNWFWQDGDITVGSAYKTGHRSWTWSTKFNGVYMRGSESKLSNCQGMCLKMWFEAGRPRAVQP